MPMYRSKATCGLSPLRRSPRSRSSRSLSPLEQDEDYVKRGVYLLEFIEHHGLGPLGSEPARSGADHGEGDGLEAVALGQLDRIPHGVSDGPLGRPPEPVD